MLCFDKLSNDNDNKKILLIVFVLWEYIFNYKECAAILTYFVQCNITDNNNNENNFEY